MTPRTDAVIAVLDPKQVPVALMRHAQNLERELFASQRDAQAALDRAQKAERELEQWRNVTARKDPDDCAEGIKILHGRWRDAEAKLEKAERERDELLKFAEAEERRAFGPNIKSGVIRNCHAFLTGKAKDV